MYPNQPQQAPQQYAPQQYQQPAAYQQPQQYQTAPQQQPAPAAGPMPPAPPGFAAPAPSGGDRLKPEDINGHLLAVVPVEYVPAFFPARQDRDGSVKPPADAIKVDAIDLTNGTTWVGVMWGQVVLRDSLKRTLETEAPGTVVLGRMGKGAAKGGNSAPWILEDASQDPAAVQQASAFIAARPNWRREPSTGAQQAQQQPAHVQQQHASGWPAGAVPAQPAPGGGYMPQQGYPQQQQQQPYAQQPVPPGFPPAGPQQGYPAGPPVDPNQPGPQYVQQQMPGQQYPGYPQQ